VPSSFTASWSATGMTEVEMLRRRAKPCRYFQRSRRRSMTHHTTTPAPEESRPPRQRCLSGGCDTTESSSGSPHGALLLLPALSPVMFIAFLGHPVQEPELLGKIAISCAQCRPVQEPEFLTEKIAISCPQWRRMGVSCGQEVEGF